jgi:hypothetical protein
VERNRNGETEGVGSADRSKGAAGQRSDYQHQEVTHAHKGE